MRKIASLLSVLMLLCTLAFSQTRVVTGVVRDDKGDPIPFATVTEAGTKNATQADANGLFSIRIGSNSQLTISSSGFTPQTVAVSGNAVTVSLASSNTEMKEVVVTTALGIKRQKRQVGFATTQIDSKDLTAGRATNIGSALSGKSASLLVIQPNSGVTNSVRITLRGARSLLNNNQPILVVDGTIVGNNLDPLAYLNQLNPNDIESITVLKGISSTAIYGNEAANGALVITTKKGSRSNPVINLTSTVTMEQISLMPKLQNEFGSYGGEGLDPQGRSSYIPYENQSYGPRYDGSLVPLGQPVRIFHPDGSFTDSVLMVPYSPLRNEKRKFFDDGFTYQTGVSFSTGDANGGQLYISAENMTRTGTVPDDRAGRNSVRLNASKTIRKVTISANTNYIKSNFDVVGPDVNQNRSVYWSVLNTPAHVPLTKLSDTKNNPFATPSGYFNAYYGNPWWTIQNSRQKETRDNIISNLKFELRPLSWLTASYTVTYNAYFARFQYHRNSVHYESWARDYANNGFDIYPASAGYKVSNYPGVAQEGYREQFDNYRLGGDFLLTMTHNIKKFNGVLRLGESSFEIKNTRRDVGYDPTTGTVNTYDDLDVWGPAFATGTPLSYYNESKYRSMGGFADLTLGYDNFLFLHASGRNDWESRLEKNNRSFFYPGVDLSFVFTDAIPGMKSFSALNSGKIRVAWAKVGQITVQPYQTRDIFVTPTGLGFPFADVNSYAVGGTFNNPKIKPEFTEEKEIGLELAWFKSRLLTDISVYQQNTTNQTLVLNISGASGRSSALLNIGEVQNKGIEAEIKGTIIQKKNLVWKVGVNYNYNTNKVISIAEGVNSQPLNTVAGLGGGVYAIVGKPYPYLQTTDWVRDSLGRIKVDSTGGSGLPYKNSALTGYGTTQPPHRLSVNTQLTVGNFTISALAEFRGGAVVFNQVGTDLDFTGVSANTTKFNREKFVIPNSAKYENGKWVANTDVVTNTDAWNFFGNLYNQVGSNYVTSADFWKIREVSIGYDIPTNILRKTKIVKAANIALVGRDLFIFKAKENIWTDPEFSNTSGNGIGITTNTQTPSTRKYGVSLNLTF
jgi:TonB-linked SusC/RagA family outer membrane protein